MTDWIRDFSLLKHSNWLLTAAIVALIILGVFFIYSACYVSEEQPVRTLYLKQIVWVLVGLACYLFFSVYDYRKLGRMSPWIYTMAIFMLILVLLVGVTKYGAKRWLTIYGDFGIQPSEFGKIAMLLLLARWLSWPGIDMTRLKILGVCLIIVLVPLLLVAKEPDYGTAFVFLPVAAVMMLVAGIPMGRLLVLAAVMVGGILLVLAAVFLPARLEMSELAQERIARLLPLEDYQRKRLEGFVHPEKDPLGTGWNKMQSQIAIGSGGAWGKGFLKGTQNILGFLPRSVAPTDFIYSVIAEEKGFLGSVVVLSGFGLIVFLGMLIGLNAPDKFGHILCVGVVTMLFSHVFINIAMTAGMLPITGLPLPLLSYGGSFMIVTMSALGVLQSVHIRSRRVDFFEVI